MRSEPTWRIPAGVLGLLAVLFAYGMLIASYIAPLMTGWSALLQLPVYVVLGVAWLEDMEGNDIYRATGQGSIAVGIGGIGVLYVFGITGLSIMLDKTLPEAAFLGMAYLPGDILKAVLAGLVTQSLARMRPASLLSRA